MEYSAPQHRGGNTPERSYIRDLHATGPPSRFPR